MDVNVQKQCVKVFTAEGAINMQPLLVLTQDLSGVAQQDTLVQGIGDIRDDISKVAKQGTNENATLTNTQAAAIAANQYGQTINNKIGEPQSGQPNTLFGAIANITIDTSTIAQRTDVKDGNDTAIGVAKEIRSEVGTGSDTAAETGTLFAVVKWVKDKVKSIFNLIGSPASGQPSTLFAAVGDMNSIISSQQTTIGAQAERILAFDSEVSDTYDFLESRGAVMPEDKTIENIPSTVEQIIDAHTRIPCTGITIPSNYEVLDCSNLDWVNTSVFISHRNAYVKSFTAPYSITMTTFQRMCNNCTLLEYADLSLLSGCTPTDMSGLFWNAASLKKIDISMLNTASVITFSRIFSGCTLLTRADLHGIVFSSSLGIYGFEEFFHNCPNLVWVNLLGTKATGVLRAAFNGSNASPLSVNSQTFVGDSTYDEVKNNNLKIMEGLGTNFDATYTFTVGGLSTNIASRLALINGLADVTSLSYTLTLRMKTSDMSAEDLAIATNKGWAISSIG